MSETRTPASTSRAFASLCIVSGTSGIKGNDVYNIYITGKTNVRYAVSVIE